MAKYYVCGPIEYRDSNGMARFFNPETEPNSDDRVIDTTDPRWAIPANWVPPIVGVRPMDAAAKTALDAARGPYLGLGQLPGLGIVVLEPIWVP